MDHVVEERLESSSLAALQRLLEADGQPALTVTVGDRTVTMELTRDALRLVVDALAQMERGEPVTIVRDDAELTTQQAATFLGVSRPHVVKLMAGGQIPFRFVGTHRRVRFADLRAYRDDEDARRAPILDEISALGEELDPID